jgi:hypothetical protein
MCYETFEQYQKDCELADELNFEMNELVEMNYDLAKRVCNGIGAEWFPEKLRKMISKLNPSLVIVAQNHDLNYYFGTERHSDFVAANEAFKWNGYKMACHNYKWYDVRRYWVMFQATKFCMELNACGWPAYVAAIKERKKDEAAQQA